MKKLILISVLALAGTVASAETFSDTARVVGVHPVQERVITRDCSHTTYLRHHADDGTGVVGTVVGGAVGGLVGNQFGRGRGNTLATVVGAVAGAATGRGLVEGRPEVVRECDDVASERLVGFDVDYEYHGVRGTFRSVTDPGVGSLISVSVSVTPMS